MNTSPLRIHNDTKATVNEIKELTGLSRQTIMKNAVDDYKQKVIEQQKNISQTKMKQHDTSK